MKYNRYKQSPDGSGFDYVVRDDGNEDAQITGLGCIALFKTKEDADLFASIKNVPYEKDKCPRCGKKIEHIERTPDA